MNTEVPAHPRRTPPPWLVPAGIGMIVVLLAALIVVLLTRDNAGNSSAPSTTIASTTSVTTLPTTVATTTTTTVAPTTIAPTTVPTSTVPSTTAAPVANLSAGHAALVSGGATTAYSVVASCTDYWAGLQTTSYVLVGNVDKHVFEVDVLAGEEGGTRGMQAVDMSNAISANVFGQDAPASPTYSGEVDDTTAGVARSTMTLTSGEGPASIMFAVGEPKTFDDCALGTFEQQTPYPAGAPVKWTTPDNTVGQRFTVLADCGGELLVAGGALLVTTYPENGSTMLAGLVNSHNLLGNDVWWTNLATPTATETAFDQGGGGDITAAINVYPDGDRTAPPGYLSWTQRPPRSSVGAVGLLDDVCTSSP